MTGLMARVPSAARTLSSLPIAFLPLLVILACGSDSGAITFISERDGNPEVYVMQADGAGQVRVTATDALESGPLWAPNGDSVAFVSQSSEADAEIIRATADGAEQNRVATSPGMNRQHVWSPDSVRIAFVSDRSGSEQIWHLSVDGSDLRQLTQDSEGVALGHWSPDGASLLFSTAEPPGIVMRNPDGVNVERLTEHPDESPRWSPKGDMIAFVSPGDDGLRDIYVMNADGRERRALTQNDGDNYGPRWSPDGKRICYVSTTDGDAEIFVMDADGNNQEQLTRNEAEESTPVWSPDGKRIAFVSDLYVEREIFSMDRDGTKQKRLTNNAFEDYQPDW